MIEIEAIYRVVGYTLADAFRPDPNWGFERLFMTPGRPMDDAEIRKLARKARPANYALFSVTERPGGRVIFLAHNVPATMVRTT